MFKADIEIRGKHAAYMKQLVEDNKLFTRNIDVYMTAPLIGYINGRKEDYDKSELYSEVIRKIGTQALLNEEKELDLIYRLILLLDKGDNFTVEEQVNRAFKDDSNKDLTEKHKNNMELFNSYVRGGISILYEEIINGATIKEDYLKNINDYIKRFNEETEGITEDNVDDELIKIMNS